MFTLGIILVFAGFGFFLFDNRELFETGVWQPVPIGDALYLSDFGFEAQEYLSGNNEIRFILALPASYTLGVIGFLSAVVGALCAESGWHYFG